MKTQLKAWQAIHQKLRSLRDKRLGQLAYDDGGCYCVLGLVLPSTRTADQRAGIVRLCATDERVEREVRKLGLPLSDLVALQLMNDGTDGDARRRYRAVVSYVANRIEDLS